MTCYNTFSRLDFIQDYTLKSLRLKQDKWNKLVLSDGQREYILSFIEKGEKANLNGFNIVHYSLLPKIFHKS